MIEANLPSPGIGAQGHHLRRLMAKIISAQEITAPHYADGFSPDRISMAKFLATVYDATMVDGMTSVVPAFTPTKATYSLAAGPLAGPVVDKDGSGGAATYFSYNTAVATVDANTGVVTPVGVGTTFIRAVIAANSTRRSASARYAVTVTA